MPLGPVSTCPVRAASPPRSHRFQEFRLVFVFFFFRLVTPSSATPFSFQGPPLDLLIGLHGLLGSSVIQFFKTSLNLFHFLL